MLRRFINVSLEDAEVISSETKDEIVDPAAATAEVVAPIVEETMNEVTPPSEEAAAKETTTPETPATDVDAIPAAAEAEPVAPAEEVPSADAVTPAEPVTPPESTEAVVEETPTPPAEQPTEEPAVPTEEPGSTADVPAEPTEPVATDVAAEVTPEVPAEAAVEETPEPGEPSAEPVVREDAAGTPLSEDELAIEELQGIESVLDSLPIDNELQDDIMNTHLDNSTEEQLAAVLESICVLQEQASQLIDDDKCTDETATILEEAAKTNLAQIGAEFVVPSMESFGNNPKIRHQLVLESLDSYSERISQLLDISVDKFIDNFKRSISGYDTEVIKINGQIRDLKFEFKKKKASLTQPQHECSLVAVRRFFNCETGDVLPILEKDHKFTDYVLGKYPKEIQRTFDKFTSILSTAKYSNDKEFVEFINKVATIPQQVDVFHSQFGEKPQGLLGNYVIAKTTEKMPTVLKYGDQEFSNLAKAAQYNAYDLIQGVDYAQFARNMVNHSAGVFHAANVIKHGNNMSQSMLLNSVMQAHAIRFAGHIVIGTAATIYDVVKSKTVVLKTNDIEKLIDYAEAYNQSVLDHLKDIESIISSYRKLDVALKKLKRFGGDIEGIGFNLKSRYRVWRLLNQVKKVMRNQINYTYTPSERELYRAHLGSRYCYYLAKRFVVTAK